MSKPNTEQVNFRECLRSLYFGSEIHHMFGRTAQVKINFVSTNIGHWAIIALPHQHDERIKAMGRKERRPFEKSTWRAQMIMYREVYGGLPFDKDIEVAIRDYSV